MPLVYQPIQKNRAVLSLPRVLAALRTVTDPSLSSRDTAAARSLLRADSLQALRLLARSHEPDALRAFLCSGIPTQEMCRRILKEALPEDPVCRMILLNAVAAESSVSDSRPDNVLLQDSDPVPSPLQLFRRYMIRLGAREPSFRLVLGQTAVEADASVAPASTDSVTFHVNPHSESAESFSYADFLHMVMHCVFRHTRVPSDADREIWDLACDISAEYNRRELFPDTASRVIDTTFDGSGYRLLVGAKHTDFSLPADLPPDIHAADASALYRWLISRKEQGQPLPSPEDYRVDDHSLWYRDSGHAGMPVAGGHGWDEVLNHRRTGHSHRGYAPGSRKDRILLREQTRYDFRRYLERYSVTREEVQLDPDNFDYIPYYYGLQMHPDMPFLEPLEYTEAHRVEQLVIAIDTSGSCDRETVQRFLGETHGILTRRANFFRRMEVHIMQCDSAVQEHRIIRSSEEWTDYIRTIVIQGRGGTDFTPVFRKVTSLRQEGYLTGLKGLLYFTDGDGIYPTEPTDYETAFVFTDHHFLQYKVPDWIVPLCLEEGTDDEHTGS